MSTDPKALERAWRMMEKKGPHYSTCSTMLDLDSLDVVCDCGYVEIHRLVLALPATPAPESPAPEHEPGEHWPGAPASDKSAVEKAFSAGFVAGYSNADDSYPGPDEDVALAAYLAQSPEVGTGSETSPDAGASREALAALCHEQWSGWMRYLFDQCEPVRHRPTEEDQQTATAIPEWAVERWRRQMDTAYADLSEEEKESDRKEADRIRCLLAKPAEASEAEQIPHPVAEAEQSPQPAGGLVEALDWIEDTARVAAGGFQGQPSYWTYNRFEEIRERARAALAQAPTRNAGKGE